MNIFSHIQKTVGVLFISVFLVQSMNADPIHDAAKGGDIEKIKLLISNGANLETQTDYYKYTPLHLAAQWDRTSVVKVLINAGANIEAQDLGKNTPLILASKKGHTEIVKLLLHAGANLETPDEYSKYNSLHWSASYGHTAITKLLLNAGANKDFQAKNKSTPLHGAAMNGEAENVQLLLDAGANVNAQISKSSGFGGYTPLHWAAMNDNCLTAKLLLNAHADKDIQDKQQCTPLHFATYKGHIGIVKLLINSGANVHIKQFEDKTALEVARSKPLSSVKTYEDIIKLLKVASNKADEVQASTSITSTVDQTALNNQLHSAAKKGDLAQVRKTLGDGANINSVDAEKRTALFIVGVKKHINVIKILLKKGADITIKNNNNEDIISHLKRIISSSETWITNNQKEVNTHPKYRRNRIFVQQAQVWSQMRANIAPYKSILSLLAQAENNTINIQPIQIAPIATTSTQTQAQRDELGRKLCKAAEQNNIPEVKRLIAAKATLTPTRTGLTSDTVYHDAPLYWAITKGHLDVVQILIDAGASVEECVHYRSYIKTKPLHLAIQEGHIKIAKFLLLKGADKNVVVGIETPVRVAVQKGNLELVQCLLDAGVAIDKPYGIQSVFDLAVSEGHSQIATLLIVHGGKVNKADNKGVTPLHRAASSGDVTTVKILLDNGAKINAQIKTYLQTPLHQAAMAGHTEVVELLLDRGANINAIADEYGNRDDRTPICFAVQRGHIETVKLLLKHGADTSSIKTSRQLLPLFEAVKVGNVLMINTLLEGGADIDVLNSYKQTLLHLMVNPGNIKMIKLLLDNGADVEVRDQNKNTPLHYAAYCGVPEVVELLIDAGAHKEARNKEGKTPLGRAVVIGATKMVQFFISQGANKNVFDKQKNTLLHVCAKSDRTEVAQVLIDAGLDVNAQNTEGSTPLHIAVKNGYLKLVKLLVKAKANLSIKNVNGKTVFDIAQEKSLGGGEDEDEFGFGVDVTVYKEMMQILLQHVQQLAHKGEIITPLSQTAEISQKPTASPSIVNPAPVDGVADAVDEKDFIINHKDIEFGKEIGSGAFGNVYKARWKGSDVAVKKLFMRNISAQSQKEFTHETKIWKMLTHPNIIQLCGICIKPDPYCMVMRYKPSGSLYKLLKSEQEILWTDRKQLAIDIVSALLYLHSKKPSILHRDLKSLNVLVSKQDDTLRASLTDFGLSEVKQEITRMSHKSIGQSAGTLPWMAPELLESKRNVSKKSDIYSLGMVLWELASRKVPFDEKVSALIPSLIMSGKLPSIPGDTPQEIAQIIKKCWNMEPSLRPTAQEVLYILRGKTPLPVGPTPAPSASDEEQKNKPSLIDSTSSVGKHTPRKIKKKLTELKNLLNKSYSEDDDLDAGDTAFRVKNISFINSFYGKKTLTVEEKQALRDKKTELENELDSESDSDDDRLGTIASVRRIQTGQ